MCIYTVFVQVATNQVDPQSASYSAWGNIGKPEANLAKTDKTDCRVSARPFHRSTSRTSSYPGQLMSTGQQLNKQPTILQDLSTKDSEQLNKSKSLTPQSPSSSRPNCWPNVLEGPEWQGKTLTNLAGNKTMERTTCPQVIVLHWIPSNLFHPILSARTLPRAGGNHQQHPDYSFDRKLPAWLKELALHKASTAFRVD